MKMFVFALLVAVVGGVEFKLNNAEDKACIILKLDASLSITATDNEKKFSRNIDVPQVEQANITGLCGDNDSESSALMKVDLGVGEWTLTFLKGDPVKVEQAFSFNPSVLINETLTDSTVPLVPADSLSLSSQNKSFLCKSKLQVQFNSANLSGFEYSLTQEISNLQVQAFNVVNSTFSTDVEECAQDGTSTAMTEQTTQANSSTEVPTTHANSSTEVPTTQANSSTEVPTTEPATTPVPTTPIPTPPAKPNTYALTEENRTCIVFQAIIGFKNLTYENNKNETAHLDFYIPEMNKTEVKVSGSCGFENATMETMTITFNTNWTLELTFKKATAADASLLAASEDYSVGDIKFTYYRTADIFTDVSPSQLGTSVTETAANLTDFLKGQTGGSYKCNADVKQPLGGGVSLETKDLQYKAFNADKKEDFNDNVSECSSDDESNSIVPIAVGAALAGLVVIVLIAYLIGRRRSRKHGYESV